MTTRFSKAWLVDQCDKLRKHCIARRLATEADVAEMWPDKKDPVIDWVKAYGTLRAWVWRQDDVPSRSDEAEERMLKALLEEPESVEMTDGSTRTVHPKGLRALLWFRQQDWFVGWLAARIQTVREMADRGELDAETLDAPMTRLEEAEAELSLQLARMAAVACEPGPGLTIPDELGDLLNMDPVDIYRLHHAFMEVNAGRMEALQRIVPHKRNGGSGQRMSWNVFEGTMAMRLKTDPKTLADNQSLVSQLAQVALANTSGPDLDELTGD